MSTNKSVEQLAEEWRSSSEECARAFKEGCASRDGEINRLTEEKGKLVETVKFYADQDNWYESSHENDIEFLEIDSQDKEDYCGGKLARQTLKELGIE